jgi:hypothetical protein
VLELVKTVLVLALRAGASGRVLTHLGVVVRRRAGAIGVHSVDDVLRARIAGGFTIAPVSRVGATDCHSRFPEMWVAVTAGICELVQSATVRHGRLD